jgi:cation-transporting ATPase 13A2
MSPDDKAHLIELLQEDGTHVVMVGDGANDCIALKKAAVGISISNTEASIAAPFTSKREDVSCVPILLKEGRGSLAMAFQSFKFVELQSVIQFFSITLLYQVGTDFSNNEYLYINLFIVLPLSIFMSWTKPSDHLSKD